jgi:hypothetical protein
MNRSHRLIRRRVTSLPLRIPQPPQQEERPRQQRYVNRKRKYVTLQQISNFIYSHPLTHLRVTSQPFQRYVLIGMHCWEWLSGVSQHFTCHESQPPSYSSKSYKPTISNSPTPRTGGETPPTKVCATYRVVKFVPHSRACCLWIAATVLFVEELQAYHFEFSNPSNRRREPINKESM